MLKPDPKTPGGAIATSALRTYNGKPVERPSPKLENVVEIPAAHSAGSGNVGNTGAHGNLGSNAKS
jgi:hypothetical protein